MSFIPFPFRTAFRFAGLGVFLYFSTAVQGQHSTRLLGFEVDLSKAPGPWVLQTNETLSASTLVQGNTVTVDGVVSNDLAFSASSLLTLGDARVGGTVKDNLIGMASSFTLTGSVGGDARVYIDTRASIQGQVDGDLAISDWGKEVLNLQRPPDLPPTQILLDTNSVVRGDTTLQAGSIVIRGYTHGALQLTADSITLGGTHEGNVYLHAPEILLEPGLLIRGDLVYTCDRELFTNETIRVEGLLTKAEPPPPPSASDVFLAELQGPIRSVATALFAALPLLFLMPGFAVRSAAVVRFQWSRAFWIGLMGAAAACGLALVALLLTGFGVNLQLALMLGGLGYIAGYYGAIITAIALTLAWVSRKAIAAGEAQPGTMVLPPSRQFLVRSVLPGIVFWFILFKLPGFLGQVLFLSATFTGLGAIILTIREATAMPTPDRSPEEVLDELLPKIEDVANDFDEEDDDEYDEDEWDDEEEEDEAPPATSSGTDDSQAKR